MSGTATLDALPPPEPRWVKKKEAATYAGCSVKTIFRAIGAGDLHPSPLGTIYLPELQAWLERKKSPLVILSEVKLRRTAA